VAYLTRLLRTLRAPGITLSITFDAATRRK
jgi:hypothetical protein